MIVKLQTVLAIVLIITGCSGPAAITAGSADTRCYFLDVGEGAATLIDSPDLGRILIDTGNPTSQLISRLTEKGIADVDAVIITHLDPDHTGGIHNVIEFLSPETIYDNGETLSLTDPIQRWYYENVRLDPRYVRLQAGDRIAAGNSILEVLAPHSLAGDWNANSLVLLLSIGPVKVLLLADGTFATEKILLQRKRNLSAAVLQVGHHGSKYSSSTEFLQAVRPRFAVISVDHENVNGYPAPQTLKRLEALGAEVLITSEQGDVIFSINPVTKHVRRLNHERDDS